VSVSAPPRCERCGGRLATVNLGDVHDGVKTIYRICSDCWVKLCDACPRAVKTDEDAVTHWVIDFLRDERARGGPAAKGGAV
jgi:protein-arginine kinase activator protein McsA